ncbi:MAG: hypothetical protein ACM3WV_01530 [Bacillota bacterium]
MAMKENNAEKLQETGALLGVRREGGTLYFSCERGVLRLKVLLPNCFRVTCNTGGKYLDIPSFAVEKEPVCADFTVDESSAYFQIKTKELEAL